MGTRVGIIEENAPPAIVLLPRAAIGMNNTFAEIAADHFNEACFGAIR
jgi:hypothetical protein